MDINEIRKNISISESVITLIILAGLNILAVHLANYRDSKLFFQGLYTARLTMFLFNVAICLFILPSKSIAKNKYWLLFWTGSFIAYAVHVYYSFFLFFHGSLIEFYESQGVFVASLNLLISFWWLFDIILMWFTNLNKKWITLQRYGIHILLFLAFFASTVILHAVDNKELFVIIMGIILGVSTLICLTIRIISNKNAASS